MASWRDGPRVDHMGDGAIEASGDAARAAAFRRLADHHLEAAYRLACAIVRNPAEAQDATHDAFVQAWRKWPTLRDPARLQAWFDQIVVNTCRNRLKRAARIQTAELTDDAAIAGGDPMAQALDREVLEPALASLSPDHQVVVALRFYRDLTTDEIARLLAIRPGTVRSRLHYATQQLHATLDASDRARADR
jgi:RNA polymerase sigma-70 factor, ECF subfamily